MFVNTNPGCCLSEGHLIIIRDHTYHCCVIWKLDTSDVDTSHEWKANKAEGSVHIQCVMREET